ncbi:MAG: glycosyltransferase, partial [Candidatus Hydrothermarchaeota archaeon]
MKKTTKHGKNPILHGVLSIITPVNLVILGYWAFSDFETQKKRMNILFGVSSVGLGHVRRSLAIARQLEEKTGAKIEFVGAEPALSFFKKENKRILSVSYRLNSLSEVLEKYEKNGIIKNRTLLFRDLLNTIHKNYFKIQGVIKEENFDLIVGDEWWEIFDYLGKKRRIPVVFITDIVIKFPNLLGFLMDWWVKKSYERCDKRVFIGFPEDIPPQRWYGVGENLREWATRLFTFSGPIVDFNPAWDKKQLKSKLGYKEDKKLVIGTIGGTRIGKDLLEKLSRSYSLLREHNIQLVLVCGPRIDPAEIKVHPEIKKYGYVHNLDEHLSIADCVISQTGLSTLEEIAWLNIPSIIAPIGKHYEQLNLARRFQKRENITVVPRSIKPRRLAEMILDKVNQP